MFRDRLEQSLLQGQPGFHGILSCGGFHRTFPVAVGQKGFEVQPGLLSFEFGDHSISDAFDLSLERLSGIGAKGNFDCSPR